MQLRQVMNGHEAQNYIRAGLGTVETARLIISKNGITGLWSGLGITGKQYIISAAFKTAGDVIDSVWLQSFCGGVLRRVQLCEGIPPASGPSELSASSSIERGHCRCSG